MISLTRSSRDQSLPERARREQFLRYTQLTQSPEKKAQPFMGHYRAIKAEMVRQHTWRENLRLLDIGCGLGVYSEFWQSCGFQVTGIDMNADALRLASARAAHKKPPIRYTLGPADKLPFDDQSFDVVFANSVLEHVEDWQTCIEEWIRILAPGGLLWIETTNVACPHQREFRLPLYSWWPSWMKRRAEDLARGPVPALANYTQWPAIHWFSYFRLLRVLTDRQMNVTDRFDGMDVRSVGLAKRLIRNIAVSSRPGRLVAYLFVSTVIVMATKNARA